eukprot:scaffold2056_cov129-Isochrysis_galbana.AAC.4
MYSDCSRSYSDCACSAFTLHFPNSTGKLAPTRLSCQYCKILPRPDNRRQTRADGPHACAHMRCPSTPWCSQPAAIPGGSSPTLPPHPAQDPSRSAQHAPVLLHHAP